MAITQREGLLEELTDLNRRLEKVLRELDDYLETKRAYFPRFYFVASQELVGVLASRDVQAVQVVLAKLFEGIASVTAERAAQRGVLTPETFWKSN